MRLLLLSSWRSHTFIVNCKCKLSVSKGQKREKGKKNEKRKKGHRQPYTKVEIAAINA